MAEMTREEALAVVIEAARQAVRQSRESIRMFREFGIDGAADLGKDAARVQSAIKALEKEMEG